MTISVLLVDDHIVFRESLRIILEATTDFRIVGEAGEGTYALILTQQLCPDVVVLDYMIPYMNNKDIAWWLRQPRNHSRVVILSLYNEEGYVSTSHQYGASGYVLKEDVMPHLTQAVIAVAAGQNYYSPGLNNMLTRLRPVNLDTTQDVSDD
jgi:DNA-binding NarL/FixJ family response regulator